MSADRYNYGDGLAGIAEPENCLACGAESWLVDFDGFCRGFCEAHYILSEYLIGWEDLFMNLPFEVGTWVSESYLDWNPRTGERTTPRRRIGRVYSIDGVNVVLEAWAMATFPRQAKAFGQPIDKTPYREEYTFRTTIGQIRALPPVLAREQDARLAKIMRYPTRRERDNARRARKAAARKAARK